MEHVIAVLLLLARLGDIGSTWLATPNLLLESNPVARLLRWPFALATLLVALLPYVLMPAALLVLTASLLVTASNFGKLWMIRALGEQAYYDFICRLAARGNPAWPLLFTCCAALAIAGIGAALLLFYPSENEAGYWFAAGFIAYAAVTVVWGGIGYWRLRRNGRK